MDANPEELMNPAAAPSRDQWRKNLYENQGFPDNYTDTTFLYELKKNIYLRKLTFRDTFSGAGLLTREVCVVVLVVLTFVYLYEDLVDPLYILACCAVSTALGYVGYVVRYGRRSIGQDLRLVLVYLALGYFLSPILKTLTETISTDTIYVTTALMMAVHLIFYDYDASSANVSRALSFNSALFGSLCLASRLRTALHVFVLLTVSVASFALLPPLTLAVGRSTPVLVLLASVTVLGLSYVSLVTTALYVACLLALNLLIPALVVNWQRYKENIHGPWDEANLTDSSLVTPRTPKSSVSEIS